jgi:iron(III) transport system ATP-binding protein
VTKLTVQGLHKAFGSHPVLTGVDLTVPAGSLTAILGPSGSGKTTLLRVLAGFERADGGTVQIGNMVVDGPAAQVPPEKRRIGYVPQEGSLFPHLTVTDNVGFGLPSRQRRGPRTSELLETVGLAGLGKRYPHQLSGGQQQRVALARALAIEPTVVLLDEPFASLDTHLRASVRADVQRIFRASGTTAVLVTHDQSEALSVADRVAVLNDGTIAQYAAPQDLYSRPADAAVARFIGEANLVAGLFDGDSADTPLGRLPFDPAARPATGGPVTVLIRPEQIELRRDQDGRGAGPDRAGCLTGDVISCEYYGHDVVLRVRPTGDLALPEIIVRAVGGPPLPPGSPVLLRAHGPVLGWSRGLTARAAAIRSSGWPPCAGRP